MTARSIRRRRLGRRKWFHNPRYDACEPSRKEGKDRKYRHQIPPGGWVRCFIFGGTSKGCLIGSRRWLAWLAQVPGGHYDLIAGWRFCSYIERPSSRRHAVPVLHSCIGKRLCGRLCVLHRFVVAVPFEERPLPRGALAFCLVCTFVSHRPWTGRQKRARTNRPCS